MYLIIFYKIRVLGYKLDAKLEYNDAKVPEYKSSDFKPQEFKHQEYKHQEFKHQEFKHQEFKPQEFLIPKDFKTNAFEDSFHPYQKQF